MSRRAHTSMIGCLSLFCWIGAAPAETMRCQSVNGNINCAGSSGVSCQTIDGKKTCTGGGGDVVQSFGAGTQPKSPPSQSSGQTRDNKTTGDDQAVADDDSDDAPPPATRHTRLRQQGPGGQTMLLDQQGSKLQLQTNRLSINRE